MKNKHNRYYLSKKKDYLCRATDSGVKAIIPVIKESE